MYIQAVLQQLSPRSDVIGVRAWQLMIQYCSHFTFWFMCKQTAAVRAGDLIHWSQNGKKIVIPALVLAWDKKVDS